MPTTCTRNDSTCKEAATFAPRFDLWENDQEIVLTGDLPGVDPAGLDLHYEDGQVSLVGRVAPRHAGRTVVRQEYGVGDFRRAFAVGEMIDAERIAADLRNGVLTVHLPKAAAVRPRKIEVQVA